MAKKITKQLGDQLFTKVDKTKEWEPAKLAELKTILSDQDTPYSKKDKLELPQFGFGRKVGETSNSQIYPTHFIVAEIDTPAPHKGNLNDEKTFNEWSNFYKNTYSKILNDKGIKYRIMYLTPSMCGIRFIIKLSNPVSDEDEYKQVAQSFLRTLKIHGVKEEYFDIRVDWGWFLPTYSGFYDRRREIYSHESTQKTDKTIAGIEKAISYTKRALKFEVGNRNNFIFSMACNCNRYGIEKDTLMDFLSESEYAYDL